jgi:hypothetical protein
MGRSKWLPSLTRVGRRQVDGDPFRRQRQAEGVEGGAHPFAGFGDRLVGQPDHGEDRHAARDLHLDIHIQDLDAVEGDRRDACDHWAKPPNRLNQGLVIVRTKEEHKGFLPGRAQLFLFDAACRRFWCHRYMLRHGKC